MAAVLSILKRFVLVVHKMFVRQYDLPSCREGAAFLVRPCNNDLDDGLRPFDGAFFGNKSMLDARHQFDMHTTHGEYDFKQVISSDEAVDFVRCNVSFLTGVPAKKP